MNGGLTGGIHFVARLDNVSHHHRANLSGLDAGALNCALDGDGAQIGRRHVLQTAAEGSDRRADRGGENHGSRRSHRENSFCLIVEMTNGT